MDFQRSTYLKSTRVTLPSSPVTGEITKEGPSFLSSTLGHSHDVPKTTLTTDRNFETIRGLPV